MKAPRILMDGHRVIEPVSAPTIRETWLPHRMRMIQSWLALPSAGSYVVELTVVASCQMADRSPRPESTTPLPHAVAIRTGKSAAGAWRVYTMSLQ